MLSRRSLESAQQRIESAQTPGALVEAQATYARMIVNELLSIIDDVSRGWEANHLAEELAALATSGGTLSGSSMGALQLVSFSTALSAFSAFMQLPVSDQTIADMAAAAGIDFVVSPIMLNEDGYAMSAKEIIGKMNWPLSQPAQPETPA